MSGLITVPEIEVGKGQKTIDVDITISPPIEDSDDDPGQLLNLVIINVQNVINDSKMKNP